MTRHLQSLFNKNNSFEFLLVKSGENLSIFSILFFSISTNVFVYLITTKFSFAITCLLLFEVILFTLAGFFYQKLYRKYELARTYVLVNSDTSANEEIGLTLDETAIFNRLKNDIDGSSIVKSRLLYFIPYLGYLMGILLLLNNLLPEKALNSNTDIISQQAPHTKNILNTYNQFAYSHQIYDYQSMFIDSIVSKHKFDSCVVIDALCCYGRIMNIVNPNFLKRDIKILGCYDSKDSYNFCKDSAGIAKDHLYNCPWLNIDSSFSDVNNCKLIYLLNNSLAEISDTTSALSVFKKFHKVLTTDGVLVLDFENIANKYEPLVDKSNKGIKRVRVEDSKKKESYDVEYRYYDVSRSLDTLMFSRPHYKSLMNKMTLKRLLNEAGFSNVEFSGKLNGYPFEFIEAKK